VWSLTTKVHEIGDLLTKLDACSKELSRWNKATFGNVGAEIKKLEQKPRSVSDPLERKNILGTIGEWRKKEEVLWWQHTRSDYLKYGDANT